MIFPEIIIKKESYFIEGFGQEHCPVRRLATDRQFHSDRRYGLCNTQDFVRAQADAVCFEYPLEFFVYFMGHKSYTYMGLCSMLGKMEQLQFQGSLGNPKSFLESFLLGLPEIRQKLVAHQLLLLFPVVILENVHFAGVLQDPFPSLGKQSFEFFPIAAHPNGLELPEFSMALVNDHDTGGPGSVLLFTQKHA